MTAVLTDEQRVFADAIAEFGRRECGSRADAERLTGGGTDAHSPELYAKLAALGWVGVAVPERFGGAGGGAVDACLLLEGLERAGVPVFGLGVTLIVAAAVAKFGGDAQRDAVLGSICAGRPKAIAMSEPGSGSDVASLRTSARRTGDGWTVDGQKTWITAAHHADEILVVCRTDPAAERHDGLSMLLVPADAPGVEIRPIRTMGPREVNDVFLDGVRLDAGALVGVANDGWSQLMAGLDFERLIMAAWMLGLAQRAFDLTLGYVRERRQFGRPVGSFQALRHRLADLATEIACARLLVYDTARRVDEGRSQSLRREASMAKLKASETARRAALDGMQMLGGAGYAAEYELEHLVRKALPTTIYAGTSEIQRDIIGKSLGL